MRGPVLRADFEAALHRAESIIAASERNGIHILEPADPRFPVGLQSIPTPPVLLHVLGDPTSLNAPSRVTLAGTRRPTPYGVEVAESLGRECARAGFTVASGLAVGCDTLVHSGCVAAGGRGIAVLAHGLQDVYPPQNRGLADAIVSGGGCLVSEYHYGEKASPRTFVERDRLQSGLGQGLIVVETGIDGGTMHTVRYAIAQGRPVAAVVHPPDTDSEPSAAGNRLLLDSGWVRPLESGRSAEFLNSLCGGLFG